MIGFLKGNLVWSSTTEVLVNTGNIGYEVMFPNSYLKSDLGKTVELFISHRFSEYGESLYGFETIEEKILFESLSSMKGIGPKTVFAIMVELNIKSVSDLRSVRLEELTKVSGVGKSTAQKFLLALSTKMKTEFNLEEVVEKNLIKEEFDEIIKVLVAWGIKKSDLEVFLSNSYNDLKGKSKEKVIQFVLKNMK